MRLFFFSDFIFTQAQADKAETTEQKVFQKNFKYEKEHNYAKVKIKWTSMAG